jgi:hypothetical protein
MRPVANETAVERLDLHDDVAKSGNRIVEMRIESRERYCDRQGLLAPVCL